MQEATPRRRLRFTRRGHAGPRAEQAEYTTTPAAAPPIDLYATQVIPLAFIARWYKRIVWVALFVSFAFSVFGNIGLFGGDVTEVAVNDWFNWTYLRSSTFLVALGSAAVYQLVIQIFQFRFARDTRHWKMYLALIAASVGPSLWTFSPLLNAINDQRRIGFVWVYGFAALILAGNDIAQERALLQRR